MIQDVGGVPATYVGGGYGGGDGCGWGGGIIGLVILIALLGGGNGFGFGRGNCGAENHVENRMDYNFIREGQFGIQKDILTSTNNINQSICANGYEGAKNTAAIIQNADCNTQKILDRMCYNEIQALTAKVNEAERIISEQRITGTILQSLQPPRAIPAYQVPNPYVPFGCGSPNFGCC